MVNTSQQKSGISIKTEIVFVSSSATGKVWSYFGWMNKSLHPPTQKKKTLLLFSSKWGSYFLHKQFTMSSQDVVFHRWEKLNKAENDHMHSSVVQDACSATCTRRTVSDKNLRILEKSWEEFSMAWVISELDVNKVWMKTLGHTVSHGPSLKPLTSLTPDESATESEQGPSEVNGPPELLSLPNCTGSTPGNLQDRWLACWGSPFFEQGKQGLGGVGWRPWVKWTQFTSSLPLELSMVLQPPTCVAQLCLMDSLSGPGQARTQYRQEAVSPLTYLTNEPQI